MSSPALSLRSFPHWLGGKRCQNQLDLRFQRRNVLTSGVIYDVPIHFEIVVDENVPHPLNLFPWNIGIAGLQIARQAPCRLADDCEVAINVRLDWRITVERPPIIRKIPRDNLDGVQNVLQAQAIRPHSGTASLRAICPKRPLKAPSETTSTFMPKSSRRSISSPPWSNSDRPGSNRTIKSTSDASVSSPLANEPKIRTSWAP